MNDAPAAGAVRATRCVVVVVLVGIMSCASGWRCGCSLNPLRGLAGDLSRYRNQPLQLTLGHPRNYSRRHRGRSAGIQDWSVSLAESEENTPATVALETGEGAVAVGVDTSGEPPSQAGDASPQEQGDVRRSHQRKEERRQQRERRQMRLHAFEERKKALPAVESPVVTDDERVAEATVGRSTAVDAWTIFAQRRGKLRQRGRLPQSLEEEAATAVSVDVGEDDNRYMRMALRLAEQARMVGEVPIGAVLVETVPTSSDGGQRVLSTGRNDVERRRDASAHAEILCLKAAAKERDNWRLAGATLYVTMEPCVMCLSAAQLFRVDRVVFGASNPNLGACGGWVDLSAQKHAFHDVQVTGGVLADECALILRDFFRSRRSEEGIGSNGHRPAV